MIILLVTSVLLWGKRIDEGTWSMGLLPAFAELMIELFILAGYLGLE